MMRVALAICIALIPVLLVCVVALITGHAASTRDVVEAVICTMLLLGFAAYRRRDWMEERPHGR